MAFPTTPTNSLEQLQYDISKYFDQDSSEFSNDVNDIIRLGELRVWRDTDGAFGFRKISTGSLIPSTSIQSIFPASPYSLITSMLVGTSFLLNKNETFIQAVNAELSSGTPIYYALTSNDNSTGCILLAPSPSTSLTYTIEYRSANSLLDFPNGTWLYFNAYDLLFNACLVEAVPYLRYDQEQMQDAELFYTESLGFFNIEYLKMTAGIFREAEPWRLSTT